ncbi:hypothetical protein LMG26685_01138 [Achromobacter mucicolens]|uniref:hypothetical protein n=1 Tax=Achromobacter mucicolens TaxID=1389922 RepID=UPI0009C768C7|nr:hypothetical protein [Achromobacter mucicolens]MDG9970063.1 hypothetical protein [Achromobacter mucicolens]OXC91978.1 hypothetical protein BMR85_001345 [Achromobacter sp. KAs 3-5]WGJ88599.1 hypothetical protein QEP15_14580 [Achromobacter mucicolens]CAB3633301.1 hypothetical protein LMG26685_01138 [Achromobacter mucicolens]
MHTHVARASGIKRKSGNLLLALGLAFAAAAPAFAQKDPGAAILPPRANSGNQAPAPQQAPAAQPQVQQAPARQAPAQQAPAGGALAPVQKTQINDQAAYERLLNNSGVTLQWLWSAKRGKMNAIDDNDVVRLDGTQANHEGTLKVKGEVVSIGRDSFVLRGTILILDAPDKGRRCERTGDYEFKATGKRKYWRLQQMEACGGLTDYVDIYY